jgi:hypothetical protein
MVLSSTHQFKILDQFDWHNDTLWHTFAKEIAEDIRSIYVPPLSIDEPVDSFLLWGTGLHRLSGWRGQKIFFDDVRLLGYADYDVGVKEITSSTTASPGVPYTPEARIKNFGREAADDFSIIVTVEDSTGFMSIDTFPYTLPGDTEDTVTFDEVTFTLPGAYFLHVRTVHDPDECDEDDEKTIEIAVSGVEEPVTHPTDEVNLDVTQVRAGFRVSYSIPRNQSGTLSLYNPAGRRIDETVVHGSGEWRFEGISAGVYFVRLDARGSTLSRKVVVR